MVERERERIEFRAAEYWDIVATFDPGGFDARLVTVDGRKVAQGRDFARTGELVTADAVQLDEATVRGLAAALADTTFAVRSVERKPYTRRPRRPVHDIHAAATEPQLHFSAQHTMRVAQRLYENGYITYMRTDSTSLSETAVAAACDQARTFYGAETIPDAPRHYNRKVKNAQEAHEAIRPAGDSFRLPDECAVRSSATRPPLYDLIWKRTVASQMADAPARPSSVRVGGAAQDGRDAEFGTAGTVITFRGFMLAYEEGRDEARRRGRGRAPPAATGRRRPTGRIDARGPVALDDAAGALHRGDARSGARRARHRRPSTYASILRRSSTAVT